MSLPLLASKEAINMEAAWSRRIKVRDGFLCRVERKVGLKWRPCLRTATDGAHIVRRHQCAKAKFDDAVGVSACRDCHDMLDGRRSEYKVRVPIDRQRAAWDAIKLASKVMTIGDRP